MPEYKFNFSLSNKSVSTLVEQMRKSKKWILRPEYQRDIVWTDAQKSAFISSVIEGVAIPAVIYNYEPKTKKFICIDGQQRLVSLVEFSKNRYGVRIDEELVFYSEVPEEYDEEEDVRVMDEEEQSKFDLRNLTVFEYDNLDYTDQIDIFLRNQSGKALSAGEKIKSKMPTAEISRTYHQFCDKMFESIDKFCKNNRRQHLAFIAPFILIATTEEETIPNNKKIDKYLRELTQETLNQDLKTTERLLKVLFSKNMLNSRLMNQKIPANLLYTMALYLVLNYDIRELRGNPDEIKKLRKAFIETVSFVQTSSTITSKKSKDMVEKIIKVIETKVAQVKKGGKSKGTISESSDTVESSDDASEEEGSEEVSEDGSEDGSEEEVEAAEASEASEASEVQDSESEEDDEPTTPKKLSMTPRLDDIDSDIEEIEEEPRPPKKKKSKTRRFVK